MESQKRKIDELKESSKRNKPEPPKHGQRLFFEAKLHWYNPEGDQVGNEVILLLDSGCSGPMINQAFVQKHAVPWIQRDSPITVNTADGRPMESAGVKYTESIILRIGLHQEELAWEISRLEEGVAGYLPISWLQRHNPDVHWDTGKLFWRSEYCKTHCLPVSMKDATENFVHMLQEGKYWMSSYCRHTQAETEDSRLAEAGDRRVCADAVWHNQEGGDVAEDLPEQYREYASVFSEEEINKLPEHSPWDHEINLIEGTTPPYGPIYPMSENELTVLREYLDKQLETGKIRASKSPASSPILFVPKADGTLRLCVDYRGLNKITVKDRTPLPLMSELRERVGKAKIFTKLDLRHGYNLIRIADGDEWKTAFRTKYGLFEYLVMPFGLCNAPASFQTMINAVLWTYLDDGVIVYIDDILIYSKTEEEHIRLVRAVLEKLKKANLCVALNKSSFHVTEVEYLGYIISDRGISLSEDKVKAIKAWKPPKPDASPAVVRKWAQEFLGFANFYRRFIDGFSKIALPLSDLTKQDRREWSPACDQAFETLKSRFCEAPILTHFLSEKQTVIETDASDYALGAILSQLCDDDRLHPVAYHSRKFKPAEINYDIHDKEMLAIIVAFKEWEHMLKSCHKELVIYTDHKNLEYFATTKVLSRRQARWAEFLAEFWFKVVYRPGHLNTKADVLSRRRDDADEEGSEASPRSLFKPGQWEKPA